MTNTTQLLMDASQAAGYEWMGSGVNGLLLFPDDNWNPIESDADAFRLLVAIKKLSAQMPSAWDEKPHKLQLAWSELEAAFSLGDEARCRLAITTLAAEMHRAAAQSQGKAE